MLTYMSQLMRFWYLSHRQPAKAQASLRIRAVSPEPSLFAHMNYGSRRRVRQKIRYLAPLDGCACVFEEWIYGGQKVPKSHELVHISMWACAGAELCVPHTKKKIWAMTWQNQQSECAPTEAQISLSIRPVWSESLLCTQWVAKD